MTDHHSLDHDGELLSAYLSDDLPADQVASLERRLHNEPTLARQADLLAGVLSQLHDLPGGTPPAGLHDRVVRRLVDERSAAAAPEAAGGSAPVDLAERRARREGRARQQGRWTAAVTVAAVIAAVAVLGGLQQLPGVGPGSGERDAAGSAGEGAGDLEAAAEISPEQGSAADQDMTAQAESLEESTAEAGEAQDDTAAGGSTAAARPGVLGAPLVTDDGVALDSREQVIARYSAGEEVAALLGTPAAQVDSLAARSRRALRDAPALASGAGPGSCLRVVTAAAPGPVVVAQVDSVTYGGKPALAYVLVTASEVSGPLDRAEVWLLTARGCETLLVSTL